MSFIGFKLDSKTPKAIDGLAQEGYLVHLTKAVMVKGNNAHVIINQPSGEKTIIAVLDKTQNRMVSLELVFEQSGNTISIEGDKNAEVHISGFSEPSGDMPFDAESMNSEELEAAIAMEEDRLARGDVSDVEEDSSSNSNLINDEAKEVSESSSDDTEQRAADLAAVEQSEESSSSDEQVQEEVQVEVPAGSSSSSDSDNDEYSSDDGSENVTDEDIKKMLASLDIDANQISIDSSDDDNDTEKINLESGSSTDDSGSESGSNDESDSSSSEEVAASSKKRQREQESDSSDSSDSSSTEEPPAKKSKKAAATNPDAQFENDLVKYLKANGRTPLTVLGKKVKKPLQVKAKLGLFIKGRPNQFLVKGNQVELK